MQTPNDRIPGPEFTKLLSELSAAHERLKTASQLIDIHYGKTSDEAARAEQVVLAIQRLEMDLTRFDHRAGKAAIV